MTATCIVAGLMYYFRQMILEREKNKCFSKWYGIHSFQEIVWPDDDAMTSKTHRNILCLKFQRHTAAAAAVAVEAAITAGEAQCIVQYDEFYFIEA